MDHPSLANFQQKKNPTTALLNKWAGFGTLDQCVLALQSIYLCGTAMGHPVHSKSKTYLNYLCQIFVCNVQENDQNRYEKFDHLP